MIAANKNITPETYKSKSSEEVRSDEEIFKKNKYGFNHGFVVAICGREAMKLRKNIADAGYNGANVQNSLSAGESKTTQIELGQYISLGKYNGKDVIWRCVSVDDKAR